MQSVEISMRRQSCAKQEIFMDSMNPMIPSDLNEPSLREAPRASGCICCAVLMAITVAMTSMTILALDYASVQLPTAGEPSNWGP